MVVLGQPGDHQGDEEPVFRCCAPPERRRKPRGTPRGWAAPEDHERVLRSVIRAFDPAATQKGNREAAARPPPPTPPTGPQAAGALAPDPRGREDGPPPRPIEELEHDPPPRPSRRLPQGPRRTRKPAPTRQDAAQIAPREGGRARTGVVWGATPPMDSTTPVTPALLPAQGRQRNGTRQSDLPPYRPPPAAQTGGTTHAPPPSPPPGKGTPQTRPASRSPHRACRPRGQRRAPTPARPRPQHVDSGPQQPAQWAGSRGRGSA